MPTAKTIKPFANLMAALNAFDARDLCGDLDIIAEDTDEDIEAALETATNALQTAESVETMGDFVANLQEAFEALRSVQDAVSVSDEIERILARCA